MELIFGDMFGNVEGGGGDACREGQTNKTNTKRSSGPAYTVTLTRYVTGSMIGRSGTLA